MQPLDHKVLHLQLVNALTTNDTDTILNAIFKLNSVPIQQPSHGSPLHLVVSICDTKVVQNVVSVFCSEQSQSQNPASMEWINSLNSEKQTPLHVCSKLGRQDVIEMLLQIPTVNDTIRNSDGKTAHEVCHDEQIDAIFTRYRNEFVDAMISAMKNAVLCGDHQVLETLFESNARAKSYLKEGWIDINASFDEKNERSLLHLASKGENQELVVWCLKYGADPNVKDSKGKKPVELCKSERIKDLLKHAKSQAPIISASLAQATSSNHSPTHGTQIREAPTVKGILNKWTNYRDGYQPRYFVLEGGVISYYHSINDYPSNCRGSISTMNVNAYFPDAKGDPGRFDVHTQNVKWSLKARSPAEAKKWVWALMESRVWMSDSTKATSTSNLHSRRTSFTSPPHEVEKVVDEPIPDEGIAAPDEDDDLVTFLEKFGGGEFQTPEMRRYLVLLSTEMKVQKETVQSALELVNSLSVSTIAPPGDAMTPTSGPQAALKSLKQLPQLLNDSSTHIEALLVGILRYCLKRESHWSNKLKRANEAHKRLEDIVQKMALVEPEETDKAPLLLPEVKTVVSMASSYGSESGVESDEEFYDAQDTSASFVETALGFDPVPPKVEPPPEMVSELKTAFMAPDSLVAGAQGYRTIKPYRNRLPLDPSLPMPTLAVWSFLKSAIGKDLSKITLPVLFNEPLSMLQRMCEDVEFIELLSLASRIGSGGKAIGAKLPTQPAVNAAKTLELDYQKLESAKGEDASLLRVLFVAAYAMSNYSSTVGRTNKPFNPLLGETYELVQEEKHYRYLSEQVCHHPPVSACYCEGIEYEFWTEVFVKSKFWGKSLELYPLGTCHVTLPLYDTQTPEKVHYSWKKVTTCVSNLILGTLQIDHYGDLVVKNHRTGEECVITFKPKESGGWFGGGSAPASAGGAVVGHVKDRKGVIRYELKGKWDESLSAYPVGVQYISKPFTVWKINPKPASYRENFKFTNFAMMLNQSSEELAKNLPLTDSRLRPDQKAMERSQWDEADRLKEKVEMRQRTQRKALVQTFEQTKEKSGPPPQGIEFGENWWQPRWFVREVEKDTNEEHWRFTGTYWETRKSGKWPNYVTDIFGIKEQSL